MTNKKLKHDHAQTREKMQFANKRVVKPLSNYTLSSVCPACGHDTFKLACKVRCPKCNFMWDCSEL
ncbi:MAG: hypothetical protein AAFQ52_21480 [Chloroflexota bacterium]